jgi:hypothetical protein
MSFTNNFLKALQEKGVSTTNNAGGSTPSASSDNSPSSSDGNNYTSNFLSALQKQKNMTISERAEAKAQALLKKQQEQARTPAGILSNYSRNHTGPTTSGGYYSRPDLGSYSERLYGNITALEPVLTEKRAALDTAQTSLIQAETDLKTVQGYLQQARAVYDADPTNENATSYNQIVGAYNLAYDAYASAFKTYSTAYDAYKPYEDQLIDALAVYQLYSNQQQAAFDDWRGTIRDAATIQTEIAAIDQQMADLEVAEAAAAEAARQQQLAEYQARQDAKPWYEKLAGYLGGVQDTTLPMAGVTPGTVEAAFNQPEKTPSREMQQLIAMKELLQEELNWSQYYYYADFAGAPDFVEMSKYVPQEEKEQRALDIMLDNYSSDAAPWEDPLYEYINGNEEAGAWLSNAGANYYGPDNAIGAFFGRATENKAESQQMTEQEVATFNYLYATQGKAAAHAYYDYLLADLNYRQRKSEEEYWAAEAAKNPVGTSVFSVVMSPAKGLSYIGQLTDYIGDGEIDQNAAYNKFVYTNNAIRGQVVKQIEESGKWGKVGSFAYQTGLSMADFLLASALTGNTQTVTLAIMGSGAAADTVMAAKDRGLNDDQAFTLGTIAGIAEAAMESINMETVFNPNLLKEGVLKYILKNGAAEGMEEVGTDVVNLIANILISKDQSEWQISIDNYKKQGMTESEAIARALGDQALVMASDFAGGFVSGSILSGTNAGIHVNYTNQMGNELGELDLDEEDIQAFIETGLESDPETASYQLAVEMQAKIEAGETLSNYDLARLYQANMQAIQAEEEDAEDLRDDTATDDQTDAVADDVTDPGGLSLPSVENDTRAPGFVTQNAQNGTQTQVNDTVLPDGVPLSVADQLRQEQAQNGGTQYERTYERAAGPATSQPAGELYLPGGASLPDGGAERNAGAGTAEQAGVLAGGTRGRSAGQTAFASRAAIDRQSRAKNLRLEKVSSLDLGLQNGTEARNIQVMPQENWDDEMSQLADRIYNETGKGVTYVMGRIQIRGTGGAVSYARGVITGDRIIVQADHLRISMEQIADHEAYHAKVDFTDGRLNDEIRRHIVETFSEEQYRAVLETYVKQLRCVYNLTEAKTVEEYEETLNIIEEEIFADAYAGINAFSAGADQFTGAVNEKMDQLYMGKIRNQDNGTEEPTGPPSDRYSFAGENANNADLDALARAKEMRSAGVADETIRQQTGWHTGMDGKWRWEIDDSGMEYSGRGDLGLRERRPEYARYRELLDKANRHALELSDEALTPEETAELQKLKNIWGGTFRKAGRITEDALPTELLSDYVKHDALFEAYPQLRKTRLRFADLPEGTRGQYDPEQDIITLSNKLRGKPQDTLIHEIQHVIQKAEGFTQGSSPEFWEQVQKGEQPVRANDRRVAEAERKIQEIMDSLPPFVAGQFELHRHLEKSDPDKAMELADALSEGPYGDEFSDFFLLTWDLDMAAGEDNYIRGAGDLYRNTAGEIEARDAASRRQLTVEQRRNTAPARADDHTVFVEDVDDLGLQLGDRFSVDDADDQVAIGDLQAELYQLQHQRRSLLEADTAYAAAADNLRYANTFTEKVAARKAMAAAAANIDTAAIDQRISDLNEQISEIRNRETRRHREDQEKYSGTKTAGYSTMPDTRLKDLDQDYMKAVRSGDRTRMAELVEQAAEAAMPASVVRDKSGRLLKTYHHTGNRFTVFDRNMARTGTEMDGFFFAPDPDSTSEYGSNMITAYLNITKLAMDPKLDRKFNDSGTLLREKLAYQGYDGMARTENGEIYEYMTFDPEQIKSADPVVYDDRGRVVPLSERFNFRNPDIRYSVDDGGQDPAQQKPAASKKKIRPVAESRPLIAKKDLRSTVLNLFSIPNGQRAEVGAMIDSYADRLIKNGSLTEDDRKAFFDRMYDAGVMVMPAEEYSAFARSHIVDGRIYVSDSVKSDFGDDWADIRRRAFAAGVYLVNDRSASGIDQWNATLSAEDMLPGLFDSEETDERTILERILQVAEEGKDEHLSLAEYTRRLSQQEGISEDEFLDNMERQLDWALRTFAEKARLEVHLRDRTGRKIAQEREKGNQRMTRQQAKEAQRRADERQARKDSARRAKERRELRELQQRTLKQLQWLSKNRFRAPEELQATWDEVLSDIDIYAISAADEMRWSDKHNATWKDLVEMYDKAKAEDPNFFESKELERFVARLRYKKLEDLDIDALDALYKLATGLRTKFYNQKNVINDEMQRLFAEVYTDSKREIESAPGENSAKKGKVSGWADKFLNMDQLTPMNVLQRMAGWDPDGAFYSMAKQLERGERDMRAYSVKAQKMLQDFLTEHEDWVKKADGQGKDGLWYKIEIPELVALELGKTPQFGGTIEVWMTPMQKIHMYLESKNQDNLRHMTGGRTFADKQIYSEGKRQEAFAQGKTVRMAPETVKAIVKDLTAEEMELAQILDRYYNTFATQEINKVSNILYGYDKAMGKNYAPIYTNQNYTKTEFGVFDTTAEGVGNLKGRQYAVNPSYNISAFDAFERHVDQTARFCGMAIPARNWTNLMNWREKNNSTGDVITHKWGEEGKRYITDLITTLQAGDDAKSDTISSGLSKLQSNYITAIFGANPSIVLKQLGSIPLAGAYLDARNMPTPAQISKIDRSLISKYTQELEWRTMGYATPETKQLKDNPNWTQTNKVFKFVFGGGAITAMDGWAASTLWPWAENKVRREHPELAVGTKAQIDAGESAFYKKVAEEFEIAVSRSQSVSDEIHQGTLRKSKNPITKAFTMFRSDSAQTYNALRQKIGEARYYMRTGAKEKVIQTAKKAAGTAFVAMLLNAAWSEAVSFLMALWKNKGKYYRDDEDELTLQSVAGEMVSNMLGSYAGVVTGGEELFELIGNIITGDTWYGIETPGMEQLNDLLDTLIESGSGMRDLVAGGWDVLKNGGDLGDYFSKHSGEMLGGIKDLAKAAAMYLSGMPASNLEAYLTGAMKWISPELGAAYDDLFAETGKSDLAGMEGDALEGRVGRILSDRNVSESDDTAAALAALYEAGYKTAIPSDTPTSVSIDGEKHSLGEYQQQAYDTIWGGIVADALDDMVASDSFKEADPKTQAKMLSNLYTYAAEQAKAELFDEYELDSGAAKNAAIVAAGATIAECITWNTITSEMKSGEKSAELVSWDIPEEAKREIFRCKISDSREDSIAAFDEAGLSFDQFLQAYSMYGQINNEDLKAGMKAVEFSHWVNAQGYTAEQAAVVKDELTYFNMTPASSSRYDELVGAGMDPDEAYDLTGALNELQPEDGADEVSDLQKWRASVDFSDDVEDQLAALSAVMTDAQFLKVEIANNFGVSPDAYVTLQEIKPQYDADGNGSYKNAEIQAAVDGLPGYYTTEQKAVLWQLATGSTSSRNNPYSRQVGQQVLDARAAAKEAAAQEQTETPTDSTDDDSFSQALLDQLLGRG